MNAPILTIFTFLLLSFSNYAQDNTAHTARSLEKPFYKKNEVGGSFFYLNSYGRPVNSDIVFMIPLLEYSRILNTKSELSISNYFHASQNKNINYKFYESFLNVDYKFYWVGKRKYYPAGLCYGVSLLNYFAHGNLRKNLKCSAYSPKLGIVLGYKFCTKSLFFEPSMHIVSGPNFEQGDRSKWTYSYYKRFDIYSSIEFVMGFRF